MDSNAILNQMQGIQSQMDPLISGMPDAPDFFKQGLLKAFNYNLPLLKEAAGLEAGAYTLPGKLMDEYNLQFGDTFGGASGINRLNSILGRIGSQFGMVDVANKLAEQQGGRIEDMANSLTNQYGLTLQGFKDKYGNLLPLFQTMKGSEDNAAARAAQERIAGMQVAESRAAREAAKADQLQFQNVLTELMNKQKTPAVTAPSGGFVYGGSSKPNSSLVYGGSSKPLTSQYNFTPGQMFSSVKR